MQCLRIPATAVCGLARAVGKGAGYAAWASRQAADRMRIGRRSNPLQPPRVPDRSSAQVNLEQAVREVVHTEFARGEYRLTEQELCRLVSKLLDVIQRVLKGEICVDSIPSVASPRRPLGGILQVQAAANAEALEVKKNGALRSIFEHNLALRKTIESEGI